MSFSLLTRWVQVALVGSIAVAVVLMMAPHSAIMGAYNATFVDAFWGGSAMPPSAAAHHAYLLGVSGAGVVGWAITLLFVVAGPWRRAEPWAWHAVVWSVATWVALDVALALRADVRAEALFALAAGALLLTPALLARGHFRAAAPTRAGDRRP